MTPMLALAAISFASLPSVEEAIQWLPVNTETLLVARGPRLLKGYERLSSCAEMVRILAATGLPGDGSFDANIRYEFIVDGSRKVKSLYGLSYEGCKILGLRPSESSRLRTVFLKSGQRKKMEGQDVYLLSEQRGQEIRRYHIAFIDGVMLCSTNRGYLTELLKRRAGRRKGRALPESLREWKHIDKSAPFWIVRHLTPESNKAKHDVNLNDPMRIGYAMMVTKDEKQFRVVGLSRNPMGFEIAKKLWQDVFTHDGSRAPEAQRLDGQTFVFAFEGQRSYKASLLRLLFMASGPADFH